MALPLHPARPAALLLACCMAASGSWASCATTVEGMRRLAGQHTLALRWIETAMDDGKPLALRIEDGEGALQLRFEKAREGVWAEGQGIFCEAGSAFVMRFAPGQLRPGPAAPWLMRHALQGGTALKLALPSARDLQVSLPGWQGRFAPHD